MDFAVGGLVYWAFGFALAYRGSTVGGFRATGGEAYPEFAFQEQVADPKLFDPVEPNGR